MNTKQLVQLGIVAVIIVVAGIFIYGQVGPKPKAGTQPGTATIEKVTPIPASYDDKQLTALGDQSVNRNFYTPPNLKAGMGNTQPFTPVR